MYTKYAFILKFIFLSFAYGLIYPIIFPITLLALLNIYFTNKIAIVYVYRAPPVYDDKITARALKMLKWSSLLSVFIGYWAVGNKQMFLSNSIEIADYKFFEQDSRPFLFKFWKNSYPAQLILV